jgi:hypothetical protein
MLVAGPITEQSITQLSLRLAKFGFGVIIILLLLAVIAGRRSRLRVWTFWSSLLIVLAVTAALIGLTIFLNSVSISRGPVHWHADIEIYACGQRLELVDPKSRFSNKVGTSSLHEHNDQRIHVEGVVVRLTDVNLASFLRVLGGGLTDQTMVIPTTDGDRSFVSGQACSGEIAQVQGFVFKTTGDELMQEKLAHPASYIMSPHSNVPPGDCVVLEFSPPEGTTQHLCRRFEALVKAGRLKYEY